MNNYILVAGLDGTGKSSLRGVLEGQGAPLGHIIDADAIAKENNFDNLRAGKQAVSEIQFCLENNISFTQESTLSGHRRKNKKFILQPYSPMSPHNLIVRCCTIFDLLCKLL